MMNKLKLATLTLLLAGATAVPALADDDRGNGRRGEHREQRQDGDWQRGRGGRHEERRDDRRDWRADRRDDRRDWRGDRRDDRRDWRDDRRDDRRDWRGDRRDDRREWRVDHRDGRRDWRDHRGYSRHDDRRWRGYHWYPQYRYRAPVRYVYPSGYRAYQWRVGHRLPRGYYDRHYYVDYRHYHLPPPPYGYHCVRVDRDVVLVAVATGLILDVLYGLYH
jgi:Ni/Co efflux regulator RcnB